MASSAMALQLKVFGFLPTTHTEANANKMLPDLCMPFQACLSSRSDCSTYAPDESRHSFASLVCICRVDTNDLPTSKSRGPVCFHSTPTRWKWRRVSLKYWEPKSECCRWTNLDSFFFTLRRGWKHLVSNFKCTTLYIKSSPQYQNPIVQGACSHLCVKFKDLQVVEWVALIRFLFGM